MRWQTTFQKKQPFTGGYLLVLRNEIDSYQQLELDPINTIKNLASNTSFWRDAIEKEMKHVLIAFDVLEDGAAEPRMSKRIPCHMIFDVKMDFMHKACFVAGGHMTDPPNNITYSSVVA
jgi:hypothetical protein